MPEPESASDKLPQSRTASVDDGYLNRNILDDEDDYEEDTVPELPSPVLTPPKEASSSPKATVPKSRPSVRSKPAGLSRIAFASTNAARGHLPEIEVLQNWTRSMNNIDEVPSLISYSPPENGEEQWGSDVSPDAVTMVNQKLELELQDSIINELDMTLYVLRGTEFLSFDNIRKAGPKPAFSANTVEEVIRDYLEKVFQCAKGAIQLQQIEKTKTPIDLVVTTPVGWSYKAHNAMFRAVRDAGFNTKELPTLDDTILVSEPEAAAYFAALVVKTRGDEFLEPGQTFVLCDAGGGTVDTVSYQVKSVQPFLELERMTPPSGRRCGSAMIDLAFKTRLREIIGDSNYEELDPVNAYQRRINPHTAETGKMRELIRQFMMRKFVFSNDDQGPIGFELPEPLETLTIPGRVEQGRLTLTWQEMKSLMDSCVSSVVELVLGQREKVARITGRRAMDVILVGGFGASPYLQQELAEACELYDSNLVRPDESKSLTAVVQGAVVYGIEKLRHKEVICVTEVLDSYGVNHPEGPLEWIIKKGDIVLSGQTRIVESRAFWYSAGGNSRGGQKYSVYRYFDRKRPLRSLPDKWATAHDELVEVGVITTGPGNDLGRYGGRSRRDRSSRVGDELHLDGMGPKVGPVKWRFSLTGVSLKVELFVRETVVGRCDITVELSKSKVAATASTTSR